MTVYQKVRHEVHTSTVKYKNLTISGQLMMLTLGCVSGNGGVLSTKET